MTKARLITLLLTLALAFAATPATLAQEEDAAFDPSSIPEVNKDEALILYLQLREKSLAAGVSEGDLPAV